VATGVGAAVAAVVGLAVGVRVGAAVGVGVGAGLAVGFTVGADVGVGLARVRTAKGADATDEELDVCVEAFFPFPFVVRIAPTMCEPTAAFTGTVKVARNVPRPVV
jgi:hypothetical protein